MATKAIRSQGTTLNKSDGGSPSSFTAIGNIVDFDGPGGDSTVIDQTDLDDVMYKRKLTGLIDAGSVTFKVNLDPDNVQHQALKSDQESKTLREWKIILSSGTAKNLVFFGYVQSFRINGPADDKVQASVSIVIDGGWSWA